MKKSCEWTDRRQKIASMLTAGMVRKEISGKLDISLSTLTREINVLLELTGAANAQALPLILKENHADRLTPAVDGAHSPIVSRAALKMKVNIVFTSLMFAIVVTGYGTSLLIALHEIWQFDHINVLLVYSVEIICVIALGAAMMIFGDQAARECGIVWLVWRLIDDLLLDRYLGHEANGQMIAWGGFYFEWFVGSLLFVAGFGWVYLRHKQFYILLLTGAMSFTLFIHAIQAIIGGIEPFIYACLIVIPYYFLWVIMSTGLCYEFSRSQKTNRIAAAIRKLISDYHRRNA